MHCVYYLKVLVWHTFNNNVCNLGSTNCIDFMNDFLYIVSVCSTYFRIHYGDHSKSSLWCNPSNYWGFELELVINVIPHFAQVA